jgi:hypothetical protein
MKVSSRPEFQVAFQRSAAFGSNGFGRAGSNAEVRGPYALDDVAATKGDMGFPGEVESLSPTSDAPHA